LPTFIIFIFTSSFFFFLNNTPFLARRFDVWTVDCCLLVGKGGI
jgi:hypothetical protein